ncbi:hypothetical protein [Saccharothrix australiensis]|uniref:TPR repeat protein n=1 Tax=Saccharothrix australiensis TaxID=2072 RepID=A0A495W4G2_9PSEU|nr:hypothetical protein [Saccharothrix australiensis]RKT56542.1 TPR repeat protein [Saccharothrix australiensis]
MEESVVNTVRDAHGNVVQAGTIHGGVHFGPPPPFRVDPWRAAPAPLPGDPARQPSLLLGAAGEVVPFGGRDDELRELAAWRDATPGLSVLLLHGPGGQGKTRLAARFAALSADAGWSVFAARDSPGPPTSPEGDVLVVVDYADRWPYRHLTALVERLAEGAGRARVLLVARTAGWWQAVAGRAEHLGLHVDALPLGPLGEPDRPAAFAAARDRFGEVLGAPTADGPPTSLAGRAFGSVLTVHMAALVTVMEARERTTGVPTDPEGMAAYLLRREYRGWRELVERGEGFRTAPDELARIVAAAVVTGPVPAARGDALLAALGLPATAARDHRACYPPHDPGDVLEPLYPDRLAEDFLALLLPGHRARGFDAEPWTAPLLARVATLAPGGAPANRRVVTALAAAAERWPHVAAHLADLLRAEPAVAVREGGAALEALAACPVDPAALTAVEACFPPGPDVDLDVGMAAVAERVVGDDPDRLRALGRRLAAAGRLEDAVRAAWRAVADLADPADALTDLGEWLTALGHREQGLACTRRAVATAAEPARALANLSAQLAGLGLRSEAVEAGERAVARHRALDGRSTDLARVLADVGRALAEVGRAEEATAHLREAVALFAAAGERPALAAALTGLAETASDSGPAGGPDSGPAGGPGSRAGIGWAGGSAGGSAEAVDAARTAVGLARDLVRRNSRAHRPLLARSLAALGGLTRDPVTAAEAVDRWRELAAEHPRAHLPSLADALVTLGGLTTGDAAEHALDEAIRGYRRLSAVNPLPHERRLLSAVAALAALRPDARRWRPRDGRSPDTDALFNRGVRAARAGRPRRARRHYLRAARAGHAYAMVNLGHLGPPAAAERWWRAAVDRGVTSALLLLGALCEEQGRLAEAKDWYHRGALAGAPDAMVRLARLLAAGGDDVAAQGWFEAVAATGDVAGDHGLGALLLDQGTPDRAEPHLTRAAEFGHLDAAVLLGDLLARRGDGERARHWYRRAAAAGHEDARRRLAGAPPPPPPPDRHPVVGAARELDIPAFEVSGVGAVDLAAALLDRHADELVAAGDLAGARDVYLEEARRHRVLLAGRAVPVSPRMADALTFHLATALTRAGSLAGRLRSPAALEHTAEGLALFRGLGDADLRVRSSLAQCLRIYAAVRIARGAEWDEACAAARESVDLLTALADEAPDAFTREADLSRQTLALCLEHRP